MREATEVVLNLLDPAAEDIIVELPTIPVQILHLLHPQTRALPVEIHLHLDPIKIADITAGEGGTGQRNPVILRWRETEEGRARREKSQM